MVQTTTGKKRGRPVGSKNQPKGTNMGNVLLSILGEHMSADDIEKTLERIREGKATETASAEAAPAVAKSPTYDKVKANLKVNAIKGNVQGILVNIHKLMDLNVPDAVLDQVDEILSPLKVSAYRQAAMETEYEPRTGHGGRKPKSGKGKAVAAKKTTKGGSASEETA